MGFSSFSRRETLAALASSAAAPVLSACSRAVSIAAAPAPVPANEPQALALLDRFAEHLLGLFPESATSLGVDTGARATLRSRLADRSMAGREQVAAVLRTDLAAAQALEPNALDFQMRTNFEVVRSAYATALQGLAFPYGDVAVGGWRNTPYVVIQNVGAYLDIPRFLDSDHRIENSADAEAYLARMRSYPKQLDGELGRIRAARGQGLVPPAFLLDKAIAQMEASLTKARTRGSLVESIVRRTSEKGIPGDWERQATAIARQDVAPALERQLAELKAERAIATDEAGMWARPLGNDYYRWALKASTTTDMTPDEVHEMGRRELADLHRRMDEILKQVGYSKGSVGDRMKALAKDPKYKFSPGDKGRAEIRAFIDDRLAWIRSQLPRAFDTLVDPNMEVKRLPPEEEPGAPAAYGGSGSIDGKIPGRFWINLRTTDLHSKYSLADLAFHEAIPGHIWQGEYTHDEPLIRQLLAFNSYSEGWALYAEQLADELGAYDGTPVGRLGYLQSIAFRACRLVVDTGLHAKRWTRQQAVDFFVDVNGSNPEEVASEVDRYCSWPGQACGYKVGHSTINRLREKAKAALGADFDLKAFDDAVVLGGNVPMDVLAKNVDAYIAEAKMA
ncbi:MAG TPA: DUF885 domain-containing protein [Sphingomicrobium sp.]|nr:DUF885 domain-containing protein [Sphingomicrobium sp.]